MSPFCPKGLPGPRMFFAVVKVSVKGETTENRDSE